MSQTQKENLEVGNLVHTAQGNYIVVGHVLDPDKKRAPILTRCFRMGDPAKYEDGKRGN